MYVVSLSSYGASPIEANDARSQALDHEATPLAVPLRWFLSVQRKHKQLRERQTTQGEALQRVPHARTAHTRTSLGRQAQLISARDNTASGGSTKTGSGHVRRRMIEEKRQRQFSFSLRVISGEGGGHRSVLSLADRMPAHWLGPDYSACCRRQRPLTHTGRGRRIVPRRSLSIETMGCRLDMAQ